MYYLSLDFLLCGETVVLKCTSISSSLYSFPFSECLKWGEDGTTCYFLIKKLTVRTEIPGAWQARKCGSEQVR